MIKKVIQQKAHFEKLNKNHHASCASLFVLFVDTYYRRLKYLL